MDMADAGGMAISGEKVGVSDGMSAAREMTKTRLAVRVRKGSPPHRISMREVIRNEDPIDAD
ncbi:hypothetical protein D3871_18185 [Noviherbaspirillum saxi]|uniref:Uncharacterized protein n=1 Tax=Noviherbaspirillum saxi TaxID=2320863 RepID=A0A3A3FIP7_9BURK|nr:hypothetical protein D3871_18185 [Noviherbaspirillum saxi]